MVTSWAACWRAYWQHEAESRVSHVKRRIVLVVPHMVATVELVARIINVGAYHRRAPVPSHINHIAQAQAHALWLRISISLWHLKPVVKLLVDHSGKAQRALQLR